MKRVMLGLMCMFMTAVSSNGATILIDGSWLHDNAGGQAVVDYFNNNFADTTVSTANCDNTSDANVQALIANADVLVINRRTSSGGYDANDAAFYSALEIPVVFLTSYVTRSSIMGFEAGMNAGAAVDGTETTVTADGATVFGLAEGNYDFLVGGADTLGTGSVGTGKVLATIGGNNLAVGWSAGDTDGAGRTQAGNILLWNLSAIDGGTVAVLPDTDLGLQALTSAIESYTGLTAVPEPATLSLLGLGAMFIRKRRNA